MPNDTNTILSLVEEPPILHQRVAVLEQALIEASQREQALREHAARLEVIVESSNIGAWDWNMATNATFLSSSYKAMLGYQPHELVDNAETWFQLIHPEDAPSVTQILQDYIAGRRDRYEIEHRLRHKSGAWRWILARGKIIAHDEQGQPLRMVGANTDITDWKQVEEQLRQSQSLLQSVLDNAPAAIFVKDTQGRYILANQRTAAAAGLTPDTMLGQTDADVFPPAIAAAIQANDQHILASQVPLEREEVAQQPDGMHVYLSSKFPIVDAHGAVYGVGCVATDITERKRLEEKLCASEENLQRILQHMPVMFDAFDDIGQFVRWNAECERVLGYRADEVIGNPHALDQFCPDPDYRAWLVQEWATRWNDYRGWETDLVAKDGTVKTIAWSNISAVVPIPGWGSWAIGVDVTERKRAEQELRIFKVLTDTAPDSIGVTSLDGSFSYTNPAYRALTGYGDELNALSLTVLFADDSERFAEAAQLTLEHGFWQGELTLRRKDGSSLPVQVSAFVIFDAHGQPQAFGAITRDVTLLKQAEHERTRASLQQQIIAAQEATLRELSTPLIPLADGVLAMPLIGTIDSARAQQIMETLLEGVFVHQSRIVILDITGVQVVDTQVANALIRAAQAIKLLGAQVILTGIRPQIAQMLVHLGVDLSGIVTRGTLQAGIAYALRK